jgi:rhodanese-related sulfurtransferase
LAGEKLINLGYSNVRAYEGGIKEWKSAGHKIEQPKAA